MKNEDGTKSEDTYPSGDDRAHWTHMENEALIALYDKYKESPKKKLIWGNICAELNELGFEKTARLCESKWRNLLRTYKIVKLNKIKTGKGGDKFPYFELLDQILGNKPFISIGQAGKTLNPAADTSLADEDYAELEDVHEHVKTNKSIDVRKKYQNYSVVYQQRKLKLEEERLKIYKKDLEEKRKIMEKKNEIEERKVKAFEDYVSLLRDKSANSSSNL